MDFEERPKEKVNCRQIWMENRREMEKSEEMTKTVDNETEKVSINMSGNK